MCLSCAQNSPEVTHCRQAKVGMPWLAFNAFLLGPYQQSQHFVISELCPQPHPMGSAHFFSCNSVHW